MWLSKRDNAGVAPAAQPTAVPRLVVSHLHCLVTHTYSVKSRWSAKCAEKQSSTISMLNNNEHSQDACCNTIIRKLKECHTEQHGIVPAIQGHVASPQEVSVPFSLRLRRVRSPTYTSNILHRYPRSRLHPGLSVG
jgi:hypothetical protein